MPWYRILSLDGGGIRGLLTAILLERLEQAQPGWLAQIDLFAGTSTGGLLALGLAAGKTPREAQRLYEQYGRQVFADSPLDDVGDLDKLLGAEYDIEPLKEALTKEFGDLTLGDLPKKVLVSSFDLDNRPDDPAEVRTWKAKFFHNYPGLDSDAGQLVVDVGLRTSVAPAYFPTYQGYVDGGVVANNPSVCALAQALHLPTGGQTLEDILLLSAGTGANPRFLVGESKDWGIVQWATVLVNLVMEGSAGLADYQCQQLLGERYLRLNPLLPSAIGMDQVKQIPLLQQIARQYDLCQTIEWIRQYFQP